VPSGKITVDFYMNKTFTSGSGFIHLADHGYQNPRWQLAKILVEKKELSE
jgi:hypothetical protein